MKQLIAGLAAAHERSTLHRDLKPANIMFDGAGRVRITDFGIAVAAEDEATFRYSSKPNRNTPNCRQISSDSGARDFNPPAFQYIHVR
jgi:serine/threonine protein kinase